MKINTIINRYLFLEFIPPFVISIVFFTFVFLMVKILDIINLVINYHVGLSTVFLTILYTVPYFLKYVIPMSVMMAILLTFLRLTNDNEIIAIRAGGISFYELMPPVVIFCLIGSIFTGFIAIYALPWGRIALKEMTREIALSNIGIGLKEHTFIDDFSKVTLYIGNVRMKTQELRGIFIEDKRTKDISSTIIAPHGKLIVDEKTSLIHMRLFNGTINRIDFSDKSATSIKFSIYDFRLNQNEIINIPRAGRKHRKEMTLGELQEHLKNAHSKDSRYYSILIEYYEKFSTAFGCFALGILALPLGILSGSEARSLGLGFGLFVLLLYHLLLSAGKVFGESGVYPPIIGIWMPNIIIIMIAVYLFLSLSSNHFIQASRLRDVIKKIKFFKK